MNVEVTDNFGNVITTTSTINVCKPIENFYIEGKDLSTKPRITTIDFEDKDIFFDVTAGEGTDDWYVYSVTSSNSNVTAAKVNDNRIKLACKSADGAESTISLKIRYRNRNSYKDLSFIWCALLKYDNLCFASTGNSSITLKDHNSSGGTNVAATLYISRDNATWQLWDYSTVNLADGEKLYMYGTEFVNDSNYYHYFDLKGKIKVSGSLVALNSGASLSRSYQYCKLFYESAGLIDASELKFPNKLSESCFWHVFGRCTSLTKIPPALPSTKLQWSCYSSMFEGCKSLTSIPENFLPATDLHYSCYYNMFAWCTSLTTVPENLLSATKLSSHCYWSMFKGCKALTKAPTLPALTLEEMCYSNMFQSCTNLNYVKALFVERNRYDATSNWLDGVSSSGTFVKNAAATWNDVGASGVPEGWTVQTITV